MSRASQLFGRGLSITSRSLFRSPGSMMASKPMARAISSSTPISSLVPPSSWDSHMHITDPANFAISANATYAPHAALEPEALANAARLHLPNMVLVQPSTYGTDNACLLHHLASLRARGGPDSARGVVVMNPDGGPGAADAVDDATLRAWHEQGVRGVRVNLKSVGAQMDGAALGRLLGRYAQRLRAAGPGPDGWAVQVFLDLADAGALEAFAAAETGSGARGSAGGLKLVIDHMGSPARLLPALADMPGFDALLRLMRRPGVFVKVSGYYRTKGLDGTSPAAAHEFEPFVKELLAARGGDGLVFASDWPHTRFEGWDVSPWVRACAEWAGEGPAREKLFRGNARILWDVEATD